MSVVAAMDDGEILQKGDQLVPMGRPFLVDPYCIELLPGQMPTREEMGQATERAVRVHTASAFWLGDILNLGESLFGEEASQFIDHEDMPEATVRNLTWVAKQVPPSNRQIAPTWSHCQAVAALKPDTQKEWLEKARQEDWSVAKLKAEILKASDDSKSKLHWWLVVKVPTEAKADALEKELLGEGFEVVKHSGVKKEKKPKKKKAPKAKKEVTAKKRRGSKMSSTRRKPK